MSTDKERQEDLKALERELMELALSETQEEGVEEAPIHDENKESEFDEDDEPKVQYSQWLQRGKSLFTPTDDSKTIKELLPGFYTIKFSEKTGFYLYKKDLKLDDLTRLPSREYDEVMDGINNFWSRKDKFKEYGFAFKRGILLYGPPGTGKTSIINLLCFELITKMNGVIFTVRDHADLEYYIEFIPEIFRAIEKNRPIITIIEDIDGLCNSGSKIETMLINMLDGIEQMENVVYIATTNYMENLSQRIVNRPNRFDRRIQVGFPKAITRRKYIEFKLKPHDLKDLSPSLDEWVKQTHGFTIAHIGELIKSVVILGNSFEETIKLLKDLKKTPKSFDYNKEDYDDDEPSGIGFKSR